MAPKTKAVAASGAVANPGLVKFRIVQGAMKKSILIQGAVASLDDVLSELIRDQAPLRGEMVKERMQISYGAESPVALDKVWVASDRPYELQLVLEPKKGKSKSKKAATVDAGNKRRRKPKPSQK